VRVAVSGSHRTGKTTLVEALSSLLPTYDVCDEPYRVLEDEGYEFADPPSVEDFERQLRHSIETLADAGANVLLDRCPLDFVAYLQELDEELDLEHWVDEIRSSLALLDLVVVVPIETPDRIAVAAHEDLRLRLRVDERLRVLALDDPHGFEVVTLEVSGGVDDRVRQVMRAMRSASR
jgi:predicted ATPase